ncbi:hypothetical protein MN032_07165 [Agromyces atrinae]|uniref:hypothetical protein n=1 Tax=Agromyces atrinae TaxID=592376 RepID=UPI001F5A5378|nr:hypothetical protein [Agromyces atrinae]MCI2957465.1 hypothetical protein [Agromyces atrinae]
MTELDHEARPRRAPSTRQSLIVGALIVVVGLLLAAGAVHIVARTGGDLSQHVGVRRGGVPAWLALTITGVLALGVTAFGVLTAVIGVRAARSARRAESS